jgi:NADH-quinone oxidoreductase subunit L
MVNAGVYLLARFYPAFVDVAGWTTTLLVIGLASVLLAGLLATTCNDLKRVLAYSTVSQLGFMVTGVGLGAIYESQFYLLSHAIFKALLFLGAGAIIHHVGTRDMLRMGGLWWGLRRVAVPFLIGAAALMGLPFFNGFWSKEILLETALEHNPLVYGALVLGAGLTAYYVARMCWLVFFRQPAEAPAHAHAHGSVSPFMFWPLVVLAIGACAAWLLAEPFARWLLATLPFHTAYLLPHWPVEELISLHTAFSLSTAIVMGVTLAGVLLWVWVARRGAAQAEGPAARAFAAVDGFFNNSAAAVANATRGTAAVLQGTQTGQLNWNLAGLALLAVAVLTLVLLGALS